MNNRGITVAELLVAVGLGAMLLILTLGGWQGFASQLAATRNLRTVTQALHTARYTAIRDNEAVLVSGGERRLELKQHSQQGWQTVRLFTLEPEYSLKLNAQPVFYPEGAVSPLCSILVRGNDRSWRIAISIVGRIKVTRLD